MGCFCTRSLLPQLPSALLTPAEPVELRVPLLAKIGDWLATRWLPPPLGAPPWLPDPAWLEIEWPTLPIPPAAAGVLLSLVMARVQIQTVLDLDVTVAEDLFRLTRIVATLNLRTEQLRSLLNNDWIPLRELVQLNAQIDTVQAAVTAGLFAPQPGVEQLPLAPWRQMLVKVKVLAPVVAIGQTLKLDLADPAALNDLAALVRQLRLVVLPKLADLTVVLELVAQADTMLRLQASLGDLPLPQLRAAVALKAQVVLEQLPPELRIEGEQLLGMPVLQPNPGLLLNTATVAQARLLTPAFTARLNWQVPSYEDLPLLTVGAPVASLVGGLAGLGMDPIRLSPCDAGCDAAVAMRALAG